MRPKLSFIIPFLNEEETLVELFERIAKASREVLSLEQSFEVLFVDDGSSDRSVAVVEKLAEEHPEVRLLELRGNFGKSAALAAGFDHAQGEIIFTLDADLQDDPKEIPRFIEKLEEGYDVVSGYKKVRHDPWNKVIGSRVFNWLVRKLTGVQLHDVNCGFKAYRAEVFKHVRLYGELHRFVPILAWSSRFKVTELVVEHHARKHGKSKFGPGRTVKGLTDLLTVVFLLKFDRKPSHFFAAVGGVMAAAGVLVSLYLTVLWFLGEAIGGRPLLILGVLLMVLGVQLLGTGLIAELIVHLGSAQPPYSLRRVVRGTTEVIPGSEEPRLEGRA
jgi:glycosyltransferase involved in cell wall biosynthesis